MKSMSTLIRCKISVKKALLSLPDNPDTSSVCQSCMQLAIASNFLGIFHPRISSSVTILRLIMTAYLHADNPRTFAVVVLSPKVSLQFHLTSINYF